MRILIATSVDGADNYLYFSKNKIGIARKYLQEVFKKQNLSKNNKEIPVQL